jgi:exodeoxyribonuclease III
MTSIISFNVNSIRAYMRKENLGDFIKKYNPDIMCFQETKINKEVELDGMEEYPYRYWSFSNPKKGYSGTLTCSKIKPLKIETDFNKEGRVVYTKFKKFSLINVYVPNSGQAKLKRLDYRIKEWNPEFTKYIKNKMKTDKNVIVCGDFNVAPENIDLHNPKGNKRQAGFTIEERAGFFDMLEYLDYIDVFRELKPKTIKYSYWTYFHNSRSKNKGWRIDHFLVPRTFIKNIKDSDILINEMGSDHAPIILKLK